MAIHGERGLVDLAVTAPPCGHCRQFLMELPDAKAVRVHIHRLSKVRRGVKLQYRGFAIFDHGQCVCLLI